MNYEKYDLIFPYFVLVYGALMVFVHSSPKLLELGETRMPRETWQRFVAHKPLGLVCLWVGALWILQNLWLN